MPKRILHVSFHPDGKPPTEATLLEILDRAPDWIEYAPNRWLLWTSQGTGTWYRRFRKAVGRDDSLLIFPGDFSEYEGYLPTAVWDWLRKHRPQDEERQAEGADGQAG